MLQRPVPILLVFLTAATAACAVTGDTGDIPPASGVSGERLFQSLGCAECHEGGAGAVAPSLAGIYGTEATLEGGATVTVDDDYLRQSILSPQAEIVAGYRPIMPQFGDRLSDEELSALVEYVRSLSE